MGKMPADDAPLKIGPVKKHPDRGMGHKPLSDADRAAPPPVKRGRGKMAATADSDHGPHDHDAD